MWLISIVALGLSITSTFWRYNIKWNIEIISTTVILTFVGILATFVVVSNYAQVKDVKEEVKTQITEIKDGFEKRINIEMYDYDNVLNGTVHVLLGRIAFNKGTPDDMILSFFYYVDALEYLDKSNNKKAIGGVFLGIKDISDSDKATNIRTTTFYKDKAVSLLGKYHEGRELAEFVKKMAVFEENKNK